MALDKIDIAILEVLQNDGRIPNAVLAERIGLSQSACSRRLDNLEKSGVIRGYHARLSNAALGHQMTAIVHISLSGQFEKTLSDFEAAIKRCPNVLSCHLMSGEYDYILRVAAKDLVDYERIHKEWLSAMPHVTKINSSFALREVVEEGGDVGGGRADRPGARRAQLVAGDVVTVGGGALGFGELAHRVGIREELEGVFERGQVVGADQHGGRPAVAGDDDPVVGVFDPVDHLGEL